MSSFSEPWKTDWCPSHNSELGMEVEAHLDPRVRGSAGDPLEDPLEVGPDSRRPHSEKWGLTWDLVGGGGRI